MITKEVQGRSTAREIPINQQLIDLSQGQTHTNIYTDLKLGTGEQTDHKNGTTGSGSRLKLQ